MYVVVASNSIDKHINIGPYTGCIHTAIIVNPCQKGLLCTFTHNGTYGATDHACTRNEEERAMRTYNSIKAYQNQL